MYLFANNGGGNIYDQLSIGRIYDFKIYDGNTLIRYFVPVHYGMQIGNLVIPNDGMWDMVEQQFYENASIGNFTYGADL